MAKTRHIAPFIVRLPGRYRKEILFPRFVIAVVLRHEQVQSLLVLLQAQLVKYSSSGAKAPKARHGISPRWLGRHILRTWGLSV
jgi:hypothetical protein